MTVDVATTRAFLEKRAARRRERLRALAADAQADCDRIVHMLVADFDPRRIYQWGSLLTPERFREWSDIDLALEGLTDPLAGLRALDAACGLTRFPVDLVELERIHPLHAETIRQTGKLIYEKLQ